MLFEVKGAAMRWYRKSMALVMTGYVLVVFGTAVFVRHHRPAGVELYTVAALPSLVLVAMFAVIGMYLKREKDEFQRDQVVRSALWGIAATLAMTSFVGFLRSYGWTGNLPPLSEFVVFFFVMAGAKTVYRLKNRPEPEDALIAER